MSDKEMFFHCDNCGVLCRQDATYCSNCGKSFVKVVDGDGVNLELDNELDEGVTYTDARRFIDSHPERFIDVFRKNKGKKWFLSLNLPALFIAPYWLLYRKMYINFLACLGGSTVFSLITQVIVYLCTFSTRNKITELSAYLTEHLGTTDLTYMEKLELLSSGSDLYYDLNLFEKLSSNLLVTYVIWFLISSLLFSVMFSLSCDCLYRNFVVNGVRNKKDGGVSWTGVLIYLGINIFSGLI